MTFKASPGTVIIELIKAQQWGEKTNFRIKTGKVVSVGDNLVTDFNALIEPARYCNVGDTVSFLSYDNEYDQGQIGEKDYYFTKVQDIRAVLTK